MMTDCDVLVAGAGPVGLMLAAELRLHGVDVRVLDREPVRQQGIRAGELGVRALNAPTLRVLHQRGLLPAVRDAALFWMGDEQSAPVEKPTFIGHFAGLLLDPDNVDFTDPALAPEHGAGVIAQYDLERVLEAHAGVEVEWDSAVTGFAADADGVTVHVGERRIRARWLVGCDGGRSVVRKTAGFAFDGVGPEFVARTALLDLPHPEQLPPAARDTEHGFYSVGSLFGSGADGPRVMIVEYTDRAVDRDAPVTAAEIHDALLRVAGLDVTIAGVHGANRYTDNGRQVAEYRRGRVLLAGDAAHVHSPAGGQGLNQGLGDAVNLGWKLAGVLGGALPETVLDSYTAERLPLARWVQNWTMAQSALGRPDPRSRALRSSVADLLDSTPSTMYVLRHIGGVDQCYDLPGEHPLIGRSAPDLDLGATSVAAELRPGRGLLLDAAGAGFGADWAGRLPVVRAAAADRPELAGLLVRPDGIVAWAADRADAGPGPEVALRTWFGAPA
jgi:2-polyprenyl-6-methoxyphenol hydroxylase-like FAD-dependent oxidoreductase